MCVPLPHEQDTNSADTAYEIVCLRILDFCTVRFGWIVVIRSEGADDAGGHSQGPGSIAIGRP
jgi:hypothetical protein